MQDGSSVNRDHETSATARAFVGLGLWAAAQRPWVFGLISTVAWLAVSLLDMLTGNELDLAIFYLGPVILATWFVTRRMGTALAVLSAASWLAINVALGAAYTTPLIPFWDTLVRLTFFAITILLTSRVKQSMATERLLSRTDVLTGVANMRAFEDRVGLELNHMRRTASPLTFAYVDLDNFKEVNDTMGHHEGDEVIRHIAGTLRSRLRSTDLVARLGGDEFGILLPDTDESAATTVLEQMRCAVTDSVESRWRVGITMGVITFLEPPPGIDALVGLADRRMYEGKRAGKGVTIHAVWPEPVIEARLL